MYLNNFKGEDIIKRTIKVIVSVLVSAFILFAAVAPAVKVRADGDIELRFYKSDNYYKEVNGEFIQVEYISRDLSTVKAGSELPTPGEGFDS